jgi:3',5'-cyclic AMP phosphodiesterase CpdA
MNLITKLQFLLFVFLLIGCTEKSRTAQENLQVAFMADVHLLDVYGQLEDSDYKGVQHPENGEFVLARTMEAQLHSTRLFNENYFAFLAALDDVVQRGIKYVVLPGDFSDDGQPLNVRGLKRILDEYSSTHGVSFFLTTGNHDPVRPFTVDGGKKDFLGEGGRPQAIFSNEAARRTGPKESLPVVISKDLQMLGYGEIVDQLGSYGFLPQKTNVYWGTPFSDYEYTAYSYQKAVQESPLSKRTYLMPPSDTPLPDVSYLVEPVDGVWLVGIDANVYLPSEKVETEPENGKNYKSAGIGYKSVLTHKQYLIDWLKKVTQEAEKLNKKLLVFSHYPVVDFNDRAADDIKRLLGDRKMQLHRMPGNEVSALLADAGVKVHFGGHMHINDTGIFTSENGNTVVNVQIPSLAAYVPAYKLVTFKDSQSMEVETIVMDSVPRFKELFPLYAREHDYLTESGASPIWNREILEVENYRDYTLMHLTELVRFRFLENDWPADLRHFLLSCNGHDLLMFSHLKKVTSYHELTDSVFQESKEWEMANQEVEALLIRESMSVESFKAWGGYDLICDVYKLRSADQMALDDIGQQRFRQYQLIMEAFRAKDAVTELESELQKLANIFHLISNGESSGHFMVQLNNCEVVNLE